MRNKIFTLCFFVLILDQSCFSQNDDFGIWYGLNIESSVNKKLEIDVSAMIRTFDGASKIEQKFLEAGISYKFNKYLSIAASYRIIDKLEDNSELHLRHKSFADVKGTLPVGNFYFSSRFRFQVQKKTFIEKESDKVPDYHGRIKLKLIYKIPQFPVNPYLSVESFVLLFRNSDRLIDKNRLTPGFDYKISKKHSAGIEYIFQRDLLPRISDINIISISYTYSLQL